MQQLPLKFGRLASRSLEWIACLLQGADLSGFDRLEPQDSRVALRSLAGSPQRTADPHP
jgi:hypothetical protein